MGCDRLGIGSTSAKPIADGQTVNSDY